MRGAGGEARAGEYIGGGSPLGQNVSDIIEGYLKQILRQSNGLVELQRSELADLFQCVPSQINYVIATRFSLEHGYLVESKRGGGGYIRIRKVELSSEQPLLGVARSIGSKLTQREAEGVIERLAEERLLTAREAAMLRAVIRRDVLHAELPTRDEIRARLLSAALLALAVTEEE
ncbi:MAG: CtsR family transcriptional regulator [Alicyclobacillus sp.]|nr:CtsR family transcriptional regulator [Alicyclobacillus sp.]